MLLTKVIGHCSYRGH